MTYIKLACKLKSLLYALLCIVHCFSPVFYPSTPALSCLPISSVIERLIYKLLHMSLTLGVIIVVKLQVVNYR